MNKKIILFVAIVAAGVPAFAGGYFTNTNQNVAFLRQPAHNAVIGVEGAYFNPAGIGFMNNGWHFGLDLQNITQRRYIETTYAPLAYGIDNGKSQTKKYVGKTEVPVLPHFDLAYVHDRWYGSFHFGVISGGGKAAFDDGIGSFEAPIAMLPALINNMAGSQMVTAYDADISMVGEQYNFTGQLNLGYRVLDNLSFSAGLRMNYIDNRYVGHIRNVQLQYAGTMVPAATVLGGIISTLSGGAVTAEAGAAMAAGLVGDKELDCSQYDLAYTPILSVHYQAGKLDLSARYEFNTRVRLTNDTKSNSTGISQFDDEKVVAADIPAIAALGAQYELLPKLRVGIGGNYYFEKQAKEYNSATDKNDKQDYIKGNPWEFLAGAEYDINDRITVSTGVNTTTFGFGDDKKYVSDMSFTTNSVSVGIGGRYHFNKKLSVDVAAFNTFYSKMTKEMSDYGNVGASYYAKLAPMAASIPALAQKISLENLQIPGKDVYSRKSLVFGIGFNYDF